MLPVSTNGSAPLAGGKERFKDNLSFFVPPLDAEKLAAYGEWYGLNDIFALFNTGIQTDRDELVIDYQKQELIKRMKLAFNGNYDAEFKKTYNVKNSSSYQRMEERLRDQEFNQEKVTTIHYKPLDFRNVYYLPGFTMH